MFSVSSVLFFLRVIVVKLAKITLRSCDPAHCEQQSYRKFGTGWLGRAGSQVYLRIASAACSFQNEGYDWRVYSNLLLPIEKLQHCSFAFPNVFGQKKKRKRQCPIERRRVLLRVSRCEYRFRFFLCVVYLAVSGLN